MRTLKFYFFTKLHALFLSSSKRPKNNLFKRNILHNKKELLSNQILTNQTTSIAITSPIISTYKEFWTPIKEDKFPMYSSLLPLTKPAQYIVHVYFDPTNINKRFQNQKINHIITHSILEGISCQPDNQFYCLNKNILLKSGIVFHLPNHPNGYN